MFATVHAAVIMCWAVCMQCTHGMCVSLRSCHFAQEGLVHYARALILASITVHQPMGASACLLHQDALTPASLSADPGILGSYMSSTLVHGNKIQEKIVRTAAQHLRTSPLWPVGYARTPPFQRSFGPLRIIQLQSDRFPNLELSIPTDLL